MKRNRHDFFMFLIVLPFALIGGIILLIGARDIEEHKAQQNTEYNIDSIRKVSPRLRHDPREDSLVTLEDSIHFYEDGM
ncbi:MAG: hypothetical protein J5629_06005 [Muribaculaceae bacterium]|nr:hypothetical protein [Muribaculaceae bacterium]